MNSLDFEQEEALRQNLINLIEHCPVGTCHPENCLLGSVMEMKPSDRVRWLNGLNQDSLVFLASYQFVCCEHHLKQAVGHATEVTVR